MIDCIDRYGNTSSATMPIALAEAQERGMLEPGATVLLGAFGAGFTWGAGVIEWGRDERQARGQRTGDRRARAASARPSRARSPNEGWPVGVNYRCDADGAEAVVERDRRTPAGARWRSQGDIADPETADELFKALEDEFGPVLVLVNNAGIRADGLSPQIDDDDWHRVIDTNLSAAFRLTRRALRPMLKARYGRMVNIASIVGQRANPGQANYAASKAGLVAMTKTSPPRWRAAA